MHFVLIFLTSLFLSLPASAERKTGYIVTDPEPNNVAIGGPGTIIYLNRHQTTYSPGYNNAVTNRSSIIGSNMTQAAFEGTDAEWKELMDCTKYIFAPFDLVVTDVAPNGDHIEVGVGPRPSGFFSGAAGVAPFSCGGFDSAVVYAFSNLHSSMTDLCATVGQEAAHAWGLDHEYLCEDPMTYLSGCGFKDFQDTNAACGEYEPRSCMCGGSTQNSVQRFQSLFGSGSDNAAPTVTIISPSANGFIGPGGTVVATGNDDRAIEKLDFYLDGQKLDEDGRFGQVEARVPYEASLGLHNLRVVATDRSGKTGEASIAFTITGDGNPPECYTESDCGSDEVCYQLKCWPDDGGGGLARFGEACGGPDDCFSGLCANLGSNSICTVACNSETGCPDGAACTDFGDGAFFCTNGSGDGGCQSHSSTPLILCGILGLGFLALRRRNT